MAAKIPTTTFNNGQKIPILGFGTWNAPTNEVGQSIKDAVEVGYRHIDCALVYDNEKEAGDGIQDVLRSGAVKREDLFITGKLWNNFHRADLVEPALNMTLKNLGLKYLDLYLMHFPMAYKDGYDLFPRDSDGKLIFSDTKYTETWKAMEKLVEKGLVKSIGLSNFNCQQINDILAIAKIPPATNQVECHPYLNQHKMKKFLDSKGIKMTGYGPLGSPDRPLATKDDPLLMEDPRIVAIAKKHNKHPAQILIKYQVQRDIIVISKSMIKEQIISNTKIFDFTLDSSDMAVLDSLDKGVRFNNLNWDKHHPDYPFHDEA